MQQPLNLIYSLKVDMLLFHDVVGDVLDLFELCKIVGLNTSFIHNSFDYFTLFRFTRVCWEQQLDLVSRINEKVLLYTFLKDILIKNLKINSLDV